MPKTTLENGDVFYGEILNSKFQGLGKLKDKKSIFKGEF